VNTGTRSETRPRGARFRPEEVAGSMSEERTPISFKSLGCRCLQNWPQRGAEIEHAQDAFSVGRPLAAFSAAAPPSPRLRWLLLWSERELPLPLPVLPPSFQLRQLLGFL
jgi:hypothetical protein